MAWLPRRAQFSTTEQPTVSHYLTTRSRNQRGRAEEESLPLPPKGARLPSFSHQISLWPCCYRPTDYLVSLPSNYEQPQLRGIPCLPLETSKVVVCSNQNNFFGVRWTAHG